jgi:heme/copper-type cytochrome/quinol oxidase subunit 2
MSHCERAGKDVSKEVRQMSDVTSGAVMTLVVPLSLLVIVLVLWAVAYRRSQRRATADATTPEP